MEVVELDIVGAAPDDLHWLADLLRQDRRFGHIVGFRLASEATAEERHMADDVVLVDAQGPGYGVLYCLRVLSRRPGDNLAILEFRNGSRRFHRRMREHRCVV